MKKHYNKMYKTLIEIVLILKDKKLLNSGKLSVIETSILLAAKNALRINNK